VIAALWSQPALGDRNQRALYCSGRCSVDVGGLAPARSPSLAWA